MINRLIAAVLPYMPKKLVWLFSKKYIAGETIEDAIRVSKELNARGMKVTIDLRQSIVAQGHPMRVYVPFGKEWFGYSTRRLKENPAMATHIIKALFVRG